MKQLTYIKRVEAGNELIDLELKRADGEVISESKIALLYCHLMREKLLDIAHKLSAKDAASILSVVSGANLKTCQEVMSRFTRNPQRKAKI